MNKKRKKENKKKIGSLLLLLFLTVIMLSTATYAWFTSNRTVTISDIDVNVATGSGLTISSDANNWKTLISNPDIISGYQIANGDTNYYSNNQLPSTAASVNVNPVSTIGATNASGQMLMYRGTLAANAEDGGEFYLTTVAESDPSDVKSVTTGNYVVFDAFLKLDTAENVYLGRGSGVKVNTGTDTGIKYASRIAIVDEGTLAANMAPYNYAALKTSASETQSTSITILEPNYDGHTSSGVDNANLYYSKYAGVSTISAAASGVAGVATHGVKAAFGGDTGVGAKAGINNKTANATDNAAYFSDVTTKQLPVDFTTTATGNNELLWTKYAAGVHKLRIYMWVEGQDVDCENKASGGTITYNLSFTLEEKTN